MYIKSFHLDGFGIFADTTVEDLSPGLNIFLGSNEAGKSTCLEFLRTMLTGYADPRSKHGRRQYPPLNGGQAGGSLVLALPQHATLQLTRRPGPAGGLLTLNDADGHPVPVETLQEILHGVSAEVYRNVFGFSLSELEQFESLSAEGVRNALYGASFGPGLRAPGAVLKELDQELNRIFRPNGKTQLMSTAMHHWQDTQARMNELLKENAGFDLLTRKLADDKAALAALRQQKNDLEQERRLLDRRLGVWRQRDEWCLAGTQLERLGPLNDTFPEDGQARFSRAVDMREQCQQQWAAHRAKVHRLQERRDEHVIDTDLLAVLPELQRLAERKSSYRQALDHIAGRREECRRAEEDLKRELTRLGPDWSCERIRNTDRSLFAHEDLEKQARELNTAHSAQQAAVDMLNRANRDVEHAAQDVAATRQQLALLPAPVAALDEHARDALRHDLARLEDDQRQLPARQRAVQTAQTGFSRSYDALHLTLGSGPDDREHQDAALRALLDKQDEALALAARVQEQIQQAEAIENEVHMAVEQEEDIKRRMEELRAARLGQNGPSRSSLDSRAQALRTLRSLAGNVTREQERLHELDARLAEEKAPSPVKSLPLLVVGGLLIAAGVAILLAYLVWGITSFPITATLAVPVGLWSGYLVLACGVGFLAGGLPRSGPEAKQHQQEMLQLRSRRDTCAAHVAELEEQARQLCETAGVDGLDGISLDAAEMLLMREREICVNEERSLKDMDALKQELARCRSDLGRIRSRAHEQENTVQQTRRRWHELMLSLRVGTVPSPEGAAAFFARAETAALALNTVTSSQADMDALLSDMQHLEDALRAVPSVQERLSADADRSAVTLAVRQVLESCREADAARDERIKTEATLQNNENEQERATKRQAEAAAALAAAEERLNTARSAWSHCLKGLGLGQELDPETVREAFKYMENSLALEASLQRARSALAQDETELAALREPLTLILARLNRDPEQSAGGGADWLASLDSTLALAQSMENAQAEYHRLDALVTEEQDETRAAEAALDEARHNEASLLALAGAEDAEDFLRLAALHDEQTTLLRRRADLEDALRLAAAPMPLEDFLATFKEGRQAEEEKRSADIGQELESLQDQEQELAAGVAELQARVNALEHAEELADLRQQCAARREDIQRLAERWSRLALARELLLEAKLSFERERQPQVIRQASEIFHAITGGRWRGMAASLEDASLSILPPHGEPVQPALLSRGTQEQAYLALRLAYIQNHAAHASPLPIIMDEVLVNFDPQRASQTARAFASMTKGQQEGQGHQLLYFTCHPFMVDILQKVQPEAALFTVENGGIHAA